jgi:asparagine synthase (glutamine-hydrolysing)
MDEVFAAIERRATAVKIRGGVERLAYQFLTTYLPEDILTKTDRASMFKSLEVRAPFLSRDLVEFACALPTRLKLHRGVRKYLLRRLACRYLPAPIVYRKKHGFAVPIGALIRTRFRSRCEDTLLSADNPVAAWFRRAEIERLLREHFSARTDHGKKLWALYILFAVAARRRASAPIPREPGLTVAQ